MTSDDAREELARVIREETVRQLRESERNACPAGSAFYEENVAPYHTAGVVLDWMRTAGYGKRAPAGDVEQLMADRHRDLGRLMEAVGVYNDGIASPSVLFERCLAALSTRPADESAGVAEALEKSTKRLDDLQRGWGGKDYEGMRRQVFDNRAALAARAARAPAADASGVEG